MAQAARKNWFAIWVTAGVVVALALVVVLVVVLNNVASGPAERPVGAGINSETGAIQVGDGPNELDVWFDFYCPHCQEFESAYGPTVDDLLTEGELALDLYPVALSGLNSASGTDFSKRSANAMYCVAADDPDAAYPFMQSVFATNPSGPGLTDEELLSIAADAGSTGVDSCVADGTYIGFVEEQTTKLPTNPDTGSAGTPTVILNGEFVTLTGDPQADLVDRLR